MKKYLIIVLGCSSILSSCKENIESSKVIVNKEKYEFNIDSYLHRPEFEIDSLLLDNGNIVRHISSKNGPDNALYTIHSSEGNLILIAGKCSESQDVSGYVFGYNTSGLVEKIWNIQSNGNDDIIKFEYNSIDVLDWKKAVEERAPTYILTYDDNEELKHIDGIETPDSNYNISAFVKEGADFWTNDIQGGDIQLVFYFQQNSTTPKYGFSDFVFIDGKIAAEIFYNENKNTTIHYFNSQGNSLSVREIDKDEDILKIILNHY